MRSRSAPMTTVSCEERRRKEGFAVACVLFFDVFYFVFMMRGFVGNMFEDGVGDRGVYAQKKGFSKGNCVP